MSNSAPIVAASHAAGYTVRFQQRTPSAPVSILSAVSISMLISDMIISKFDAVSRQIVTAAMMCCELGAVVLIGAQ